MRRPAQSRAIRGFPDRFYGRSPALLHARVFYDTEDPVDEVGVQIGARDRRKLRNREMQRRGVGNFERVIRPVVPPGPCTARIVSAMPLPVVSIAATSTGAVRLGP